jgi:hypothetical protein
VRGWRRSWSHRLRFYWRRWRLRWRYRHGRSLFADDGLQHISRFGDVRQINFGFDFIRLGTAGTERRFSGSLRLSGGAELGADFVGFVFFQRTGVGLLFRDSYLCQDVKNRLAFDFQFPG